MGYDSVLQLFGVEEGDGLSPFGCAWKSPEELVNMVEKYFVSSQSDQRGRDYCSGDRGDANGRDNMEEMKKQEMEPGMEHQTMYIF